jgi:hypothetical protein
MRCTTARSTKSGGRQPAVVLGVHLQEPPKRGDAVRHAGAIAFAKPRGADAPRSWLCAECGRKRLCDAQRTSQERRASARRGCGWANVVRNVVEAHLQSRLRNHGGLTPPAPGCVAPWMRVGKLRLMRCTTARSPRAAGVSPPWFGNTVRTGADFFGLNMFLQRTFGLAHHGWLTPAALDARRWCP